MKTRRKDALDKAEAFSALADALSDYATCLGFAHWLIENEALATGTAIDTRPEALAYGYAIRFSHSKAALDLIIGEPDA